METPGSLIDKLTIVNLKIWHFEDSVRLTRDSKLYSKKERNKLIAEYKESIDTLNQQRNDLIDEYDKLLSNLLARRKKLKVYGANKKYGDRK